MLLATLRTLGGSVIFAIPRPILEGLGLAAARLFGVHPSTVPRLLQRMNAHG
jgi:hypothetical protein